MIVCCDRSAASWAGCAGCAARDAEIAELRERVARLERLLSRDRGNSSLPPSSDDLPGRGLPRKQRRAAERAARKRGKQPGAPGAAMSWAEPDQVIDHRPAGACECGADLAGAQDLGVARSPPAAGHPRAVSQAHPA
jgi:hypothetical protein